MLYKLAIVGPESTGKSKLAEQLAAYYNTKFVPEIARDYLNGLGRNYTENDLLQIAKKQQDAITKAQSQANTFLFVDTELLVIKIWSQVKYKKVHPWILDQFKEQDFDLFLLTNNDIPWEADPLREHPNKREYLFKLYEKELKKEGLHYKIIGGQGQERILNAIKIIDDFFQN
ncbi:MAG: ATP-binding protein [Bacteroidales bacterium]|nr:ATP-binding protein [Bacteroidales bacterium]